MSFELSENARRALFILTVITLGAAAVLGSCSAEKGVSLSMSAAAAASRLLEQLPPSERRELEKAYSRHFYSGCGKSLACRDICPAGIDTESLMVNSNAAAVWKFLGRRKHG